MCGIGGKLYFDSSRDLDPALLHRMNAVLAHRGPDDAGVYHDGAIGLAHRRLAIIDLDHCFMEFAASIPSGLKLKGRTKKYLFKQAVRGFLPAAVIDRPKMGFGVPIDRWFRHELREMAYDTLLCRRCLDRGLFRQEVIRQLLDEHVGGRDKRQFHLWCFLVLELWFQRFIDQGVRVGT